eukprot:scaffold11656_cov85-Skeletonema_dohrnii-CCMP3373.AAC.6
MLMLIDRPPTNILTAASPSNSPTNLPTIKLNLNTTSPSDYALRIYPTDYNSLKFFKEQTNIDSGTSSIDAHIRRNNGSEEESVASIDEHIKSNNNGNEEAINQEAVNSHEAVTQQVSHDNVTQLRHHHVKEEDNRDCLSSMGLYTPSSFMQSLRIKYQVGLEGHA